MLWQKQLYKQIGSKKTENEENGKKKEIYQKNIIKRVLDMAKVLQGLHLVSILKMKIFLLLSK